MKMRMKKLKAFAVSALLMVSLVGCAQRQSDIVSYNLSQEADNFNVARKITIINTRTDTVQFSVTGNFSIEKESDGDLSVIGENKNGTYYKHFIYLSRDISYIVEDLGTTGVDKYDYQINFNPAMALPVEGSVID